MADMGKVGRQRQILLVLGSAVFLSVASSISDIPFNNFVNDTFHISAGARGHLEFPRELPGFLTAVLSGALFFMVETRTAALAALGVAVGLFGLAARGDHYLTMVAFMILWSAGAHLMMPLQGSITLRLAEEGKQATLLGRLGSAGTAATIVGCAFLWLSIRRLHLGYSTLFAISAIAAVAAALFLLAMHIPASGVRRRPFLVRRRYSLFYILSILFGARKQIFITFGPWVLIKVFHQPASTFATLIILSSIVGVFLKPALGRWIDRYGERPILVADALLLVCVCLGYGFAERLGLGSHAITLIYACYMLDQILFATGMARTTYLDKMAVDKSDIAPTLSLGVSLDHAVSMTVPTLGGLLWDSYGYPYVFVAAAGIALLNAVAAASVRTPKG